MLVKQVEDACGELGEEGVLSARGPHCGGDRFERQRARREAQASSRLGLGRHISSSSWRQPALFYAGRVSHVARRPDLEEAERALGGARVARPELVLERRRDQRREREEPVGRTREPEHLDARLRREEAARLPRLVERADEERQVVLQVQACKSDF